MDLISVIGTVLAFLVIIIGTILKGAHVSALLNPAAFVIVFVGTLAALLVQNSGAVLKHALKNALVPVVAVLSFQITVLLGGALIVEQVFAINGLGTLAITAVRRQDIPMIQGLVLVMVGLVVIVQLATDLIYGYLNPKARPS